MVYPKRQPSAEGCLFCVLLGLISGGTRCSLANVYHDRYGEAHGHRLAVVAAGLETRQA